MRVAVTGADGQLGHELCHQLGEEAIPIYEQEMDLRSRQAVSSRIQSIAPDVVINTAAFTDVDGTEADPDACRTVNVDGTHYLADACQTIGSLLVQISTDYVFGLRGVLDAPLLEHEATSPQGIYAHSKLESEKRAAGCARHLIVRTCGLYARRDSDHRIRNFAKTMLQLGRTKPVVRVVNDQHCTPSYAPHVAQAILHLVRTGQLGMFHIVNSGATTWHGFATELFRQAGINAPVEPITTAQFATAAARPSYSVLDTTKYHASGGPRMPKWQTGIADYLSAAPNRLARHD